MTTTDAATDPATAPARRSSVVNNVVYQDGRRLAAPASLHETFDLLSKNPTALAWIGLYRPDTDELGELQREFGLHELAIEDAALGHQRPKLERYGDTLFMVLRAAKYDDADEEVDFGELHIFAGTNFLITVRHSEGPDLSVVRRRMEKSPDALREGAEAVLYGILDAVVDGYGPVVAGLANDIDEIEVQVFDGDPKVSKRIYLLNREVIDFERAVTPLTQIIKTLAAGYADGYVGEVLEQYLRDVDDHVTQIKERVEEFRALLRDILQVNATLVAQRQAEEAQSLNEQNTRQAIMSRRIAAWAAILFAPSIVTGIYGMNFRNMPELGWTYGYPIALGVMVLLVIILYLVFKRRGWL
ncbi:magnesium and cobalt transport protein CorA [Pseudolysinimonas sp.]|uniref:magnesium and cobalt transport protein CorA n=1 Tax=Pseudolysinimonas sp. TaxID=2680009 RepID=UPI003F816AD5